MRAMTRWCAILIATLGFIAVGCKEIEENVRESETTQGALIGTAAGAGTGALAGEAMSGDAATGALVGGALGGAGGAAIGHTQEDDDRYEYGD